jgi:hypothetical protein
MYFLYGECRKGLSCNKCKHNRTQEACIECLADNLKSDLKIKGCKEYKGDTCLSCYDGLELSLGECQSVKRELPAVSCSGYRDMCGGTSYLEYSSYFKQCICKDRSTCETNVEFIMGCMAKPPKSYCTNPSASFVNIFSSQSATYCWSSPPQLNASYTNYAGTHFGMAKPNPAYRCIDLKFHTIHSFPAGKCDNDCA